MFATWVNISGGVVERLIACGVQDLPEDPKDAEDFGFTAEDIGDYFGDVLETYGRNFEAIEFICGDNTSVNGKLADLITLWLKEKKNIDRVVPLIGCASHRLNLAVQTLYAERSRFYEVVERVHVLMVELGTLKNRYKLASKTTLNPVKRNDTRWGSVFAMLKRYVDLKDILDTCPFKQTWKDKFLLKPYENYLVTELMDKLYECEKTSLWLQTHDARAVSLRSVRAAFDHLVGVIDELETKLSPDADVVHSPAFENALVKLQRNLPLTKADKALLVAFKKGIATPEEPKENETHSEMLERLDREAARDQDGFKSTFHVSPTSNIAERLFSRAGIIMRPSRRGMDPSTLEMLLMLRFNKDMWSEESVQNIIDRKKAEVRARQEAAKRKAQEEAVRVGEDEE